MPGGLAAAVWRVGEEMVGWNVVVLGPAGFAGLWGSGVHMAAVRVSYFPVGVYRG